ncbi:putative Topless family protein [Helianthus annuus]|nr:putative Topless family protein [Helianthus annuus]
MGSRVDYEAPSRWCTTMAYSADVTSKDGESHIVEWNESEGAVKVDGSASRTPEAAKPTINALSAVALSSAALAERVASVGSISAVNGDARSLPDVKPRIVEESDDKSKIWKLSEINEASQC